MFSISSCTVIEDNPGLIKAFEMGRGRYEEENYYKGLQFQASKAFL